MMRSVAIAGLIALGACAGCATNPFGATPKRAPGEAAELQKKADALLDYAAGTADSIPVELFSVAPLAEAGKDAASEIQDTADEMRQHHAEIVKLKAHRVLGEDNRGYLALRDEDTIANSAEKNAVQQAMAAENDCRKTVYRGIARASEEKGLTLTRVERAFAARRLVRSVSGAVVQLPSNDDEYAAFLQSPRGKTMGQAAHPGDWVELP